MRMNQTETWGMCPWVLKIWPWGFLLRTGTFASCSLDKAKYHELYAKFLNLFINPCYHHIQAPDRASKIKVVQSKLSHC